MATKIAKDDEMTAWRFDAVSFLPFDIVASVSASTANTSIQAYLPVPVQCKIPKIVVSYSAIGSVSGNHQFNIALGTGTYASGGAKAASSTTISGTPNHDGTVTVTVNGHAVVYTEVSGDTTPTLIASHVVTAVNADTTANKLVLASSSGAVFTLTALSNGAQSNAITVAISSTDSAPLAFTAFGPTLTGGVNIVATVAPNDFTLETGPVDTTITIPPTVGGNASSGVNIPAPGVNGDAIFSTDQGLTAAANTPQIFIPDTWDAYYSAGQLFTLRTVAPANGSITNFKVVACVCPIDPYPTVPAGEPGWSRPGTGW